MPTQLRNLTPYRVRRVISPTNANFYEWMTPWLCCDGVDTVRGVLKAQNTTGATFQSKVAIQYAAVRADNPDAPTSIGNAQTGDVEYNTQDITISGTSASKRLFRLGVQYASTNASVTQGDVSLQVSWNQLATDLGKSRVMLSVADSNDKFEPITAWRPAIYMAKVKAAFILTGITPANGNLRYKLSYQTATTTVEQPNAWITNAEAQWTQPANTVVNAERNTGEVTITTTDMWFRLGAQYSQAGGVDANYIAVLDAICSCR